MDIKVGIVGLGYVGLPLAVEASKHYQVVGYDINGQRIEALVNGRDTTMEVSVDELRNSPQLTFTSSLTDLSECNFFIITVPTPVDAYKNPDLRPLLSATSAVGSVLKKNDIVVYESTVYPGCTEDDCVPLLELESGLKFNEDFFCGYSPERINPGDTTRRLPDIKKITSGSTPAVAETIDRFYASFIPAGTHRASSIKIAEAAKVIENAQRDINIAFVNELALIFEKMNLDTLEVLEASSTKWNFLPFKPGLVGGHCIGVDPYYLTHKAESLGHHPDVILAGRRINDNMGAFVATQVVKLMAAKKSPIVNGRILVLGITFKENCPDIRNSRVIDIVNEFRSYDLEVDVYDPWANKDEVLEEYNIALVDEFQQKYSAIVLAVAHTAFKDLPWPALRQASSVIYDVKGLIPREFCDKRL